MDRDGIPPTDYYGKEGDTTLGTTTFDTIKWSQNPEQTYPPPIHMATFESSFSTPEYHSDPVYNSSYHPMFKNIPETEHLFKSEYSNERTYNLRTKYLSGPVQQIEPMYHLEPVEYMNSEGPLVPIHNYEPSEEYHPEFRYPSEPIPQTDIIHLTSEIDCEPTYIPTSTHLITSEIDHKPKYYPGSENPYQTKENQRPFHLEPLDIVYPEPMAEMPSEPERPIGSDHSSADDNREYLQLLSYQDEHEAESFYEPNILRHDLNANKELVSALQSNFLMAEHYNATMMETYFQWLGQVKTTFRQRKINKLPYPLDDWVLSTLCLFPRDRFWMEKTNELLEGKRTNDFHSFLTYLQGLVLDHM